MKRRFVSLVKVGLGLTMVVWIAAQLDLAALRSLSAGGPAHQLWLGGAYLLLGFAVFQALRLHALVRGYTQSVMASFKLFFIGALFNNLLPSNIGGDAVRLMYLRKLRPGHWGAPLALLALHRLSQLGLLLVLAGLYVAWRPQRLFRALEHGSVRLDLDLGPQVLGAIPIAGGLLLALLWLRPRLRDLLADKLAALGSRVREALAELRGRDVAALLAYTLLFHLSRMLGVHQCLQYFGQQVAFLDLLPVFAVMAAASLVPLSIGALGVMEGSMGMLLVAYGAAP